MSENVLQTLQQLVQNVIAPDVRELKVRMTSLEKQMDVRFDAVDQKIDARFDALMAAISESKAQADLTSMRVIASLSERVAVLESQRHSVGSDSSHRLTAPAHLYLQVRIRCRSRTPFSPNRPTHSSR